MAVRLMAGPRVLKASPGKKPPHPGVVIIVPAARVEGPAVPTLL